jgi:chaperonin GroES
MASKTKTQPNNNDTMATKIQPLGQRVLVKRIDSEEKTAGGIYLPDTAKEKPQEAKVVALGTGGKDDDGKTIEFTVKVGDTVLISKYGGTEVKIDGEEHLIVSESDILGILKK